MDHKPLFDIIGIGGAALDTHLYVDAFPQPNQKIRITDQRRDGGGPTGTALVMAARLGVRCAFAGALGVGPDSDFITRCLVREGIDLGLTDYQTHNAPISSTILIDKKEATRTIIYNLEGILKPTLEKLTPEIVSSCRVLMVDSYGTTRAAQAAAWALDSFRPIVGDLERTDLPGFEALLDLTDHLIVPHLFAQMVTATNSPAAAVDALWNRSRKVVVVTAEREGCWFKGEEVSAPMHAPAFPVREVDTTGCGDVFHGAYAVGLIRGFSLRERIRLASAAAALQATKHGSQTAVPQQDQVEQLLKH
jgi:sulfofructose kinase